MIGPLAGVLAGIRSGVRVGVLTSVSAAVPTYVAKGAMASGAGDLTPALPAGIAVNDILILVVNNSYSTTTAATLSGAQNFVAVTGGAIDSGAYLDVIHSYQTVFWRRYNGNGSAPTVADNGDVNAAQIFAFRGCVTSGDPWDQVLSDGDPDGDTTMTMTQAGTTAGSNRLVVTFVAAVTNDDSTIADWACAALTDITEIGDTRAAVGGDRVVIAAVTGAKAAAGAFSNLTATWSVGTVWVSAGVTISLKP